MILDHFWLTEPQSAKITPHLPTDTRGKARVDNRRVISGIVHVIKSGGRAAGLWAQEDAQSYVRWTAKAFARKQVGRPRRFSSSPRR